MVMSDEQQNIAAQELAASVGLISVITDSNFSVTTNNGIVVKCNPSDKKYKIYAVVSKVEWILYVGYTATTLEKRAFNRQNDIRKDIIKNKKLTPLHMDIVTLGSDNFLMFELCAFDNKKNALECEKRLIEEYKSHVSNGGYNGSSGGEGGLSGATSEELERESNDATLEIIQWTLEHDGVTPNQKSTDPVEKKLREKLHNFRQARNNPNGTTCDCYNVEQIATDRGFPHLLYSLEEKRNLRIREFADFVKEYNRTPKRHSGKEKELWIWWDNTKHHIKTGSTNLWTDANKKLAEELGVAHYFMPKL